MEILKTFFGSAINKIFVVILVALIAVASFLFILYKSSEKSLNEANTELATTKASLNTLQKTYDQTVKSNEATDKIREELKTAITGLNDKLSYTASKTNNKIDSINSKYNGMPATDANNTLRANEISSVRLDSMLSVYCIGKPTDKLCDSADTKKENKNE